MPRGVKAKAKTSYVSIAVAENGWVITATDLQYEDRKHVFTDLGELLGFLEEELER